MHPPRRLSLIEHFKDLPDPRVVQRCDHNLLDVLVIVGCTLLCRDTWFDDMADFGRAREDRLETFLTLRHGIPSQDTFEGVVAALTPEALLDYLDTARREQDAAVSGLRRAGTQDDLPRAWLRYLHRRWQRPRERAGGLGRRLGNCRARPDAPVVGGHSLVSGEALWNAE